MRKEILRHEFRDLKKFSYEHINWLFLNTKNPSTFHSSMAKPLSRRKKKHFSQLILIFTPK